MSKCLISCDHFEKQLVGSVARIELTSFNLELFHDNLFIDPIVANSISLYTSMWSMIHIFLRYLVDNGCAKRKSWLYCSLSDDLHVKYAGKFVEESCYWPSFLDTFFCEES